MMYTQNIYRQHVYINSARTECKIYSNRLNIHTRYVSWKFQLAYMYNIHDVYKYNL